MDSGGYRWTEVNGGGSLRGSGSKLGTGGLRWTAVEWKVTWKVTSGVATRSFSAPSAQVPRMNISSG